MKTKTFLITRLEESKVLKRISYEIAALNKKDALKKLSRMDYEIRDTVDEVREDEWKPIEIIELTEI